MNNRYSNKSNEYMNYKTYGLELSERKPSERMIANYYNTKSNQIKVVKTPGGVLRAQHLKKAATRPKCGDCGIALPGVAALRPREYATVSKTKKHVSRAYGGSRCANCVKERIVRAFLIEEQKIVKKLVKDAAKK